MEKHTENDVAADRTGVGPDAAPENASGRSADDAAHEAPAGDGAQAEDLTDEAAPQTDGEGAAEARQAEVAALQDKLLRQAAEFQNYRRRTEQEKAGLVEFGKRVVLQQFLDVWDDLTRSKEAAEQAEAEQTESAYQALKQGVDLVSRKFADEMARLGVEPIEAVGKPFDEREHDAMMQQPAPEGTQPGTVLGEIQKGYRMGDHILRHSKVIVAAPAE